MSDDNRGIYHKYKVERTDGSSKPGGKHENCAYFVLDLAHDEFAVPALRAYAKACRKTQPKLAKDIELIIETETRPSCGCRSAGECMHGLFAPDNGSEQAVDLMARAESKKKRAP